MRKVICLLIPTDCWLGVGTISRSYCMYMGLAMISRHKCIQQNL